MPSSIDTWSNLGSDASGPTADDMALPLHLTRCESCTKKLPVPCPKPWIKIVEETKQIGSGDLLETQVIESGPTPATHLHDPALVFVREYFVPAPRGVFPPGVPPGGRPPGFPFASGVSQPHGRRLGPGMPQGINDPRMSRQATHQGLPRAGGSSDHLMIHSPTILAAVRDIVQYYPSQNLVGESIRVDYPYRALVHHYQDLEVMRDSHASGDPSNQCKRLANMSQHLQLLLDFLDREIMPEIREEEKRIGNGLQGFEHAWYAFQPGTIFLETSKHNPEVVEDQHLRASVIHQALYNRHPAMGGGETFTLDLSLWSLEPNGGELSRRLLTRRIPSWVGEQRLDKTFFFQTFNDEIIDKDGNIDMSQASAEIAIKIDRGQMYRQLTTMGCHSYTGKIVGSRGHPITGLVMTDLELAEGDDDDYKNDELHIFSDMLSWMRGDDLKLRKNKCDCSVCVTSESATGSGRAWKMALFQSLTGPTPRECDLTLLLLPSHISAFVFKTKKWEKLNVTGFTEPVFDEEMITKSLVMREERKSTLQELTKSFYRRNKRGNDLPGHSWTADFLPNKRCGLIFLLHGQPGVGKTCTAECVAACVKRPLMVLGMSDIGTTAEEVETNLDKHFTKAQKWGVVLLIDEADVFMERRTTADLKRNTLVAAFLRALDNYEGILFLTTNRVGSFDDAFISRVHIQLYYPDFTEAERQQVWNTFLDKLLRERGSMVKLSTDAEEYVHGAEVRSVMWNGREIRNAIQSAVQLAEYDDERDEEGKILVTGKHLKSIVELSREFKGYMKDLHGGNEGTRAVQRGDRLDDYADSSDDEEATKSDASSEIVDD